MDKQLYVPPKVVRKGQAPESVEAGCCLCSCGGSPRAPTGDDRLAEVKSSIDAKLRSAL